MLFGLGVIAFGMTRLDAGLTPGRVGVFLVMLLAGTVIIYSFMLILSTLAFWFVRLDNVLVIFQTMFGNAGSWPITIYPGWLRTTLTFFVPVAFAVTIPAESLTGRLEGQRWQRWRWRRCSSRRRGGSGGSRYGTTPRVVSLPTRQVHFHVTRASAAGLKSRSPPH